VKNKIPSDVNPVLGPDATSLGWGFSYAVVDETGGHDLSELRSIQDYIIKLGLESVPGVSQVASIGGFVKQYQITVDPNRLLAYNIPITKVMEAVRKSNQDVEGRVLELSGVEYMIRGRDTLRASRPGGYIRGRKLRRNANLFKGCGPYPTWTGNTQRACGSGRQGRSCRRDCNCPDR